MQKDGGLLHPQSCSAAHGNRPTRGWQQVCVCVFLLSAGQNKAEKSVDKTQETCRHLDWLTSACTDVRWAACRKLLLVIQWVLPLHVHDIRAPHGGTFNCINWVWPLGSSRNKQQWRSAGHGSHHSAAMFLLVFHLFVTTELLCNLIPALTGVCFLLLRRRLSVFRFPHHTCGMWRVLFCLPKSDFPRVQHDKGLRQEGFWPVNSNIQSYNTEWQKEARCHC